MNNYSFATPLPCTTPTSWRLIYSVGVADEIGLRVNTELLAEIVEVAIGDEMIISSFIRGFEIVKVSETSVLITLPSTTALDYVKKEYKDVFSNAVQMLFNKNLEVHFILKGQDLTANDQPAIVAKRVDKRFTFDNYVVASFNEEAVRIARQIVTHPGVYSPVFITSKSGLGKTHLLHAIGNALASSGLAVIYIDPNGFTRDITEMSREGGSALTEYVEKIKQYDVLLFDDIQNLGDRTVTLRVLFELINHHIEQNKQIVVASDKLVKELSGFEARFITRFSSGLTTLISEPSIEDLVLVLEKKLTWRGLDISRWEKDALRYVARNNASSIRALEGAIKRISFFLGEDTNAQYTVKVIANIFRELEVDPAEITPQRIIQAVSSYYKINTKDILGKSRKKDFVLPRHLAIFLIRRFVKDISLVEIGRLFTNRDHTSVLAAIKKIETLVAIDRAVKLAIDRLEQNIRAIK